MSEKEIINISDCEFYGYDGVCKLYSVSICSKDCSNYPNCYFKQLKRKEQECKRLKEEIKTNGFGCFNIEMSEQLDQLKVENEKVKKQLERKEENYQKLLNKSNKYIHNLVDENVQDISNLARQLEQLKRKEQECKRLKEEIAEIKKYLGISDKTIIQRLEELQEFKDELKMSEYNYKQALDDIENLLKIIMETNRVYPLQANLQKVLNIINKVKEQ